MALKRVRLDAYLSRIPRLFTVGLLDIGIGLRGMQATAYFLIIVPVRSGASIPANAARSGVTVYDMAMSSRLGGTGETFIR